MNTVREHSWHLRDIFKKIRNRLCIQAILERMWDLGIIVMPFYWVLELYDPAALAAIEDNFKEYTFEPFGPEEMKIMGKIKGRSPCKKEADLLKLLDEGHKCYGIKYKGDIAAFTWVSFNGCTMETYRPPMKEDEIYLFDMYTLASFRGKDLAPYLRLKTQDTVSERGDYKFYSITDFFNKSSIKFKQKINAKFVRKVWYFRLWSLIDFWRETDLVHPGNRIWTENKKARKIIND